MDNRRYGNLWVVKLKCGFNKCVFFFKDVSLSKCEIHALKKIPAVYNLWLLKIL